MYGVWRETEVVMFFQYDRNYPKKKEDRCEFVKKIDTLAYDRYQKFNEEISAAKSYDQQDENLRFRERINRASQVTNQSTAPAFPCFPCYTSAYSTNYTQYTTSEETSGQENRNYKRVVKNTLEKEEIILKRQKAEAQGLIKTTITEKEREQINSYLLFLEEEIARVKGRIKEICQSLTAK